MEAAEETTDRREGSRSVRLGNTSVAYQSQLLALLPLLLWQPGTVRHPDEEGMIQKKRKEKKICSCRSLQKKQSRRTPRPDASQRLTGKRLNSDDDSSNQPGQMFQSKTHNCSRTALQAAASEMPSHIHN